MDILLFGDVHGRYEEANKLYNAVLQAHKSVDLLIQVGDLGYFPNFHNSTRWVRSFDHPCLFIDGNHDDHRALRSLRPRERVYGQWEYMPRGTVRDGILFIGGARSIDANYRIRGVDWWPEENISYREQEAILDTLLRYEGEIHTVISHDAPGGLDVSEACTYTGTDIVDGNRKFLQHVLDTVAPKRWYFGHYHKAMRGTYQGCEWRCLDMIREDGSTDYEILTL